MEEKRQEVVEENESKDDGLRLHLKKAIDQCIEQGILADYLKERGSDAVIDMLLAEYAHEADITAQEDCGEESSNQNCSE